LNKVLDYSLVTVLLLASALYAMTSLGPRSLRPRLLAVFARLLAHAPAILGLRGMAQRLLQASTAKGQGACGGCDNCAPEQSASQQVTGAGMPAPGVPGGEVRVPVAKIGRRA
jgi:hypothetical protein